MNHLKRIAPLSGFILLIGALLAFLIWPGRPIIFISGLIAGGLVLVFGMYLNRAGILASLTGRSVRSLSGAVIYSLVVLALLAAVNFLGFRHPYRVDFTEEGVFTLAGQTVEILAGLQRPVEVIGFLGEGDEGNRQRMKDLFESYRYHTSRVSFRFVDPFKNPGEVAKYDVSEAGVLVFVSGDQQTRVVDFNEEKVTNAIRKVSRDEKKMIYFTRGHGEREPDDFEGRGVSSFRDALKKQQYGIETVELLQVENIPGDATVLVVAGAEVVFLEPEAAMVEGWLGEGNSLLVLADPGKDNGLGTLLAGYGLQVEADRVINTNPISQLLGFDALVPIGSVYVSHPIVADLRAFSFFPDASSVKLIEEVTGEGIDKQYLVQTDASSWGETDPEEIQSGRVRQNDADRPGPIPLAALATAPARQSAPPPDAGEGEEATAEPAEAAEPDSSAQAKSRVVLFGDSDFSSNQFFNLQGNSDLLLSVIAWLSEQEDLISIRPKRVASRTLMISRRDALIVRLSTVIIIPLALLTLGMWVWLRRRHL